MLRRYDSLLNSVIVGRAFQVVRWSGKYQCVLGIERHISDFDKRIRVGRSMIEGCSFRDGGKKERHTVVVEGGTPLTHGGMDSIEYMVGIVDGGNGR